MILRELLDFVVCIYGPFIRISPYSCPIVVSLVTKARIRHRQSYHRQRSVYAGPSMVFLLAELIKVYKILLDIDIET
jgi:hypothetical protein